MGVVDVGWLSSDSTSVDGLEADAFIRRLSKGRDCGTSQWLGLQWGLYEDFPGAFLKSGMSRNQLLFWSST